jgi:hypothetical protein
MPIPTVNDEMDIMAHTLGERTDRNFTVENDQNRWALYERRGTSSIALTAYMSDPLTLLAIMRGMLIILDVVGYEPNRSA